MGRRGAGLHQNTRAHRAMDPSCAPKAWQGPSTTRGPAAALRRAASALDVRGEESMLDAAVRLDVGHGQLNDFLLLLVRDG